jgi:hypothetical protein
MKNVVTEKIPFAEHVCEVYKKVCQGEDLSKIKAPVEVKGIITEFSKCSITMSAYEISKVHPSISSDLASKLRQIRKIERRNKHDQKGVPRRIGLGETVRQLALGVLKADIKKAGGTEALNNRANRFIKLALKNKSVAVVAEKLSLSEYTAKIMLENFDKNYRKFYENKEAETVAIEV